jgi:hypothetical protein
MLENSCVAERLLASQGLVYVVLVRNPDFKVDIIYRQRQPILKLCNDNDPVTEVIRERKQKQF